MTDIQKSEYIQEPQDVEEKERYNVQSHFIRKMTSKRIQVFMTVNIMMILLTVIDMIFDLTRIAMGNLTFKEA